MTIVSKVKDKERTVKALRKQTCYIERDIRKNMYRFFSRNFEYITPPLWLEKYSKKKLSTKNTLPGKAVLYLKKR